MEKSLDYLDSYISWELCKRRGIRNRVINRSSDRRELQKFLEEVESNYFSESYSIEKKLDLVRQVSNNPEHKVKMFEYCSWVTKKVKIEDLGTTLPNAMGLPPEVISRDLPEVVQFVREADPDKYQSIRYIQGLKQSGAVLNKFLPHVITPGEIIRREDRMRKQHGEKGWEIKEVWGAVHDGNHRTVARVLADDPDEIECFVGRPSNDKIYEHVELD